MKHKGDIKTMRGATLDPVDCVTGGSPCQDLSIAGKRTGLAGERSGLFMDQIRIVKELREEDEKRGRTGHMVRPRFMVWENVPGAFSSNRGQDFAVVLEETIKVIELEAPAVSVPEKGWGKFGCFYDELGRWSVAWRVHDAQFWGVPQRRKRIALVADFGGLAAPEVLFERKGLSWHPDEGGSEGEGTSAGTKKGPISAISFQERGGGPGGGKGILIQKERTGALSTLNNQSVLCLEDVAGTLRAQEHGHQPIVAGFKHKQGALAGSIGYQEEQAPTLNAEQQAAVFDARGNGDGSICCTITGDHQNRITDYTPIVSHALKSKGNCDFREDSETYPVQNGSVRRLTPLECERLQGFPDGWTDIGEWSDSKGKLHKEASDTARYKALGNSIALPFWFWLLRRISAQYERPATLGSLFDGIGGFPLCWERCNGKGTALWAAEIDEFPIAVTKVRFPEGDD